MPNELFGILVVAGMFVLRIGIPLACIILIVWGVRQWEVKRWSAALARWEAQPAQPGAPTPAILQMLTMPCPADESRNGSGRARPRVPCWVMRRQAEGVVPSSCLHCERYLQTYALQGVV